MTGEADPARRPVRRPGKTYPASPPRSARYPREAVIAGGQDGHDPEEDSVPEEAGGPEEELVQGGSEDQERHAQEVHDPEEDGGPEEDGDPEEAGGQDV